VKIEISNTSHPFFTGKMKLVDTAGRVDKYMNRYKGHLDKKKSNNIFFLQLSSVPFGKTELFVYIYEDGYRHEFQWKI